MARFYVDENFPLPVVELLRNLGHDLLTVREAGKANLGIPDAEVLAFSIECDRAVLTGNRGVRASCSLLTIASKMLALQKMYANNSGNRYQIGRWYSQG